MAYINGYTYDIFISYAHLDNLILFHESQGWIEEFFTELNLLLSRRIGQAETIKFWWDNKKLDGSMEFNPYIDESIRKSAIMICLLSPAYLQSQYCKKELQTFYSKAVAEPAGLHLNNRSRIINVLLNNIPFTQWPSELNGATGFKFNDAKEKEDFGDAFETNSADFKNCLKGLREAIIKLMDEFKNTGQPVCDNKFTIFFGDVSDSLQKLKKRTIAELKNHDFEIITDIPPPYEKQEHENLVKEKIKKANLLVHLLDQLPGTEIKGEDNAWYPHQQTLLSLDCPQTKLIWTPTDMDMEDMEDDEYKQFLQNLDNGGMSDKNVKYIRGIKSELTQQIIDISAKYRCRKKSLPKKGFPSCLTPTTTTSCMHWN